MWQGHKKPHNKQKSAVVRSGKVRAPKVLLLYVISLQLSGLFARLPKQGGAGAAAVLSAGKLTFADIPLPVTNISVKLITLLNTGRVKEIVKKIAHCSVSESLKAGQASADAIAQVVTNR
ncbi:hypothetical protein RJ498_003815 [Pluralibacter gergoviae]